MHESPAIRRAGKSHIYTVLPPQGRGCFRRLKSQSLGHSEATCPRSTLNLFQKLIQELRSQSFMSAFSLFMHRL